MKGLAIILAPFVFILYFAAPANAWFHHGTATAPVTCPQGTGTPGDGCSGANQSAVFINSTFFSTVQQSGQGAYATRPPWNVAGVDFPVGAEADNTLLDVSTNVPAGCSLVTASHWIRCVNGVTLSGYRFNGWGIYADVEPLSVNNSHFTMTADNCRNYQGSGMLRTAGTGGVGGGISITNSTFDFGDGCKMNADLYGTANDPGFVDQSSGTASISGTTLTYSGTPSGTVRAFQYIKCAGCGNVYIASGSGLVWTLSASQGTIGPVTVTTGPVQTNENGPIATGGSGPLVLQYNVNLESGQFASSSNEADARWNYEKIISVNGQHVNFIFNSPSPGTTNSFVEDFNTVYWDQYAENGGTGTVDYFTQKSGGTGQVTATLVSLSNNTVVANNSKPNSSTNTNALVRFLSQSNTSSGTIKYTLTGGVMTVTSVGTGVVTAGYYAQCTACSVPILISAFGGTCAGIACTGSGGTGTYLVSNSVDTVNMTAQFLNVGAYPGIITTLNVNNNYFDKTGASGAYNFDVGNVPVGTLNSTGNKNMLTGNSCNYGGTCN